MASRSSAGHGPRRAGGLRGARQADAHAVAAGGDGVGVLGVDLEILAAERPVPRRLRDALRARVLDEDRRLVVDVRIDRRLEALRHRGHRDRPLAVHQPRHQVGAVAAEVEQGAGAVLHRVAQPGEELGLDVDLLRALVAVHHHHLAQRAAGLLLLQQLPDRLVARIPGGLVVGDDVDAALGRGPLDGAARRRPTPPAASRP